MNDTFAQSGIHEKLVAGLGKMGITLPTRIQAEMIPPVLAGKDVIGQSETGTGKTHLAQAFGRACCEHGLKAYFIKMTELRDRMTDARRAGSPAARGRRRSG